jgi:nucleoside-diphosphate kinase
MESTLVLIKPNGVRRGLIGEIISRYEKARLAICAIKIKSPKKNEIAGFYQEHSHKPFFPNLMDFMTSGPIVMMVLQGENAVQAARAVNGATNPADAAPGSIRYDFAPDTTKNIVHASDSNANAEREIQYWFQPNEIAPYPAKSFISG